MRHDSFDAKKLSSLLRRIKARHKPEEPPACEPVTQMVIGFLQWQTSRRRADRAFTELMEVMVDINELRVSHPREIFAVIGEDYPLASERVARMRETLNEVYKREHDVAMTSVEHKGKKEQRAYLETLPGIMPYVTAQVMLVSYGGHAFPVDEKLVTLLAGEEVLEDPAASPAEVESFVMRHVKADDALRTHASVQAWSDARRIPVAAPASKAPAPEKKKKKKKAPVKRAKKK